MTRPDFKPIGLLDTLGIYKDFRLKLETQRPKPEEHIYLVLGLWSSGYGLWSLGCGFGGFVFGPHLYASTFDPIGRALLSLARFIGSAHRLRSLIRNTFTRIQTVWYATHVSWWGTPKGITAVPAI